MEGGGCERGARGGGGGGYAGQWSEAIFNLHVRVYVCDAGAGRGANPSPLSTTSGVKFGSEHEIATGAPPRSQRLPIMS